MSKQNKTNNPNTAQSRETTSSLKNGKATTLNIAQAAITPIKTVAISQNAELPES